MRALWVCAVLVGCGGGSSAVDGGSAGGGSAAGGRAGGSTAGGSTAGGSTAGGSTAGGSTAGGSTAGGSTAGGSTAGGSTAGGSAAGGSAAGGSAAGGSTAGGSTAGGSAAGGSAAGGSTAGGSTAGGSTAGGSTAGGSTGGGDAGSTFDGGSVDAGSGFCTLDGGVVAGVVAPYFYTPATGACFFTSTNTLVGAVGSALAPAECGTCLRISPADGGGAGDSPPMTPQFVVVSDVCPTCAANEVDLSNQAYGALTGGGSTGRWNVLVERVECPPSLVGAQPFVRLLPGANAFFVSIIVEGTVRPIRSVSVRSGTGTTFPTSRGSSNEFTVSPNPALVLPIDVLVTDVNGNVGTARVTSFSNAGPFFFGQFASTCP